jgi:hypothetical protein
MDSVSVPENRVAMPIAETVPMSNPPIAGHGARISRTAGPLASSASAT